MDDNMARGREPELRGDVPREVIDVLDAVSQARDMTRMQLVNEILGKWAKQVMHEHSLVARVCRINPAPADAGGAVRVDANGFVRCRQP